ncbi:hypothetical protein [Caballeronia sp. ATUFL_M2_KS44]|uniref:hypothetical protein n=1 Tax=Caballeronia sp. ATUFL_M2_KS44 TaxID=2921767 RepID=UPI0020277B1C|nr:hypothetical protein [Caballeronia sp. ATUFL_M2_KS44]
MTTATRSLHAQVEKWLPTGGTCRPRVRRFGRTRAQGFRFVCVEAADAMHHTLVFFRHRDGAWRVFPPAPECPAMRGPGSTF